MKYVDTKVVFAEVPDEITLAVNISNCPCHCEGCHSPYLAENIGEHLNWEHLDALIQANKGITCIAFMGGDADPMQIDILAEQIRNTYPMLKIAWYSGRQELSEYIDLKNFDFIKLGPYTSSKGGLDSLTTNQRFYQVAEAQLRDITYKFWH